MPIPARTCVPRGLIRRGAARRDPEVPLRSAVPAMRPHAAGRGQLFSRQLPFSLKPRMESCRAAHSRRSPPRPCPAEPLRHRSAPPGLPRAGSSRCCYERQGGVCPSSRAKFCAAASAGIPPCASAPRICSARLLSAAVGRCPPRPPAAPRCQLCGHPTPLPSRGMGVTGKFVTALTRAWCRALLLLSGGGRAGGGCR